MSAPTAPAVPAEAAAYLADVGRHLGDLPAEDRSALMEDLAQHVVALVTDGDDRPLVVRLGQPAAYAAELRTAAGLPAPALGSALPSVLRSVVYGDSVRAVLGQLRRMAVELRPAWWVLRGYLLVAVVCLARPDAFRDFPVPAPLGSHVLGVGVTLAVIAASVALGRQRLPRTLSVLIAVAGVALVVAALGLWQAAGGVSRLAAPAVVHVPAENAVSEKYPLVSRYGPVTDVLPYAADGTPLEDVLLFDQDGRPLQVGFQEWWADGCQRVLDQPRAADGAPVPYSFPQRYELEPSWAGTPSPALPDELCRAELARPEVPIPVYPAAAEPSTEQPAAGD